MSERHYLERELYEWFRSSDAPLDFLQTGSLDGIWFWDIEHPEHEWYSPAFTRLLGYEPHEVPAQSTWWQERIFEEDLSVALDNFAQHQANPDHPYDQVVRYRHRDGSTVWVRCRGLLIRGDDGTPRRMLGAHTDVTTLKRAEIALQEHTLQLEANNAELQRFARVAAHDLKEPLRTVRQFVHLLVEQLGTDLDPDARVYTEFITQGCERMSSLVTALMGYATASAEFEPRPVALEDVAGRALAGLAASIEEHRAAVTLGALPTVPGHDHRLLQVFQNLVGNALTYRHPDRAPEVVITGQQRGTMAEIRVQDNGIGIPTEQHQRVFEPFHRLHPRETYPGNGIGLALVQRIVRSHGGRAWIDAAHQDGTMVCFTLPR